MTDKNKQGNFVVSELAVEPELFMEANLPDERGASSYSESSPDHKSSNFIEPGHGAPNNFYKEIVSMHEIKVQNLTEPQDDRFHEHVVPFHNNEDITQYAVDGDLVRLHSDGEVDCGYSSHSTSSSCQVDSVQMEQGSQVGYGPSNLNIDWSDTECEDGCLHGENEVEDLLYHFDRFFRGRLENEMHRLHDSFSSMLTEQQIHVRQIVNTAIDSCHQVPSENVQDQETSSLIKQNLQSQSPCVIANSDTHNTVPKSPLPLQMLQSSFGCQHCTANINHDHLKEHIFTDKREYRKMEDGESTQSKDKLLLRLLSLVCGINSLLQRKEYRT